jgi:hypothetical protein
MKIRRPNLGLIIIIVSVIGFFSGLYLPQLQTTFEIPYFTLLRESILSLILLLVLCLISAGFMLWAYSTTQWPQAPLRIFVYGFVISASSVIITMGLGFLQGQYVLSRLGEQFTRRPLWTGYINFFSHGVEPVFFTGTITAITLLWVARWQKTKDGPAALLSSPNRNRDIVLIVATLVIYAVLIKTLLDFIIYTFFIYRWGFAP